MPRSVLVVGTTADYVETLERRHPDRLVFLTDTAERAGAAETPPPSGGEILADLADAATVLPAVRDHLDCHRIRLSGVACFDCESLALAVEIATALHQPFPSPEAIRNCRDKAEAKRLWQAADVPCARGGVARTLEEALELFAQLGGPCVLKPRSGTGGALVTIVRSAAECAAAFTRSISALVNERGNRLYSLPGVNASDLCSSLLVEEFLTGPEYSCDFVIDGDRLDMLRTACKVPPFAYIVPASPPVPALADQLRRAAQALGLERALCMADFIVVDGKPVLLEVTPRPGGDCLPRLVRHALGRDILGAALDLAEGLSITPAAPETSRSLVGLMLPAGSSIASPALEADDRVIDLHLSPRGSELVFAPSPTKDIESQCRDLRHAFSKSSSSC